MSIITNQIVCSLFAVIGTSIIKKLFIAERCDNNCGSHPAAHSSSDRFNHITSREELSHQGDALQAQKDIENFLRVWEVVRLIQVIKI